GTLRGLVSVLQERVLDEVVGLTEIDRHRLGCVLQFGILADGVVRVEARCGAARRDRERGNRDREDCGATQQREGISHDEPQNALPNDVLTRKPSWLLLARSIRRNTLRNVL